MDAQAQLLSAFPISGDEASISSSTEPGFASGLCTDKAGNILVVDNGDASLKVFNQSGDLKHRFGKKQLTAPWGVAVTHSGKTVVTDPGSGSLKVFSKTGKFLLDSAPAFHLTEPYGIAYHRDSKELTVGDKGTNCLYLHNPNGVVTNVVTEAAENNPLKFPAYVCYDDSGKLYVSDYGNQCINVYDDKKQFMYSYGKGGDNGDTKLCNPCGIVVDHFGNLLVADSGNSRVHLVDQSGEFVDFVLSFEDGLSDPQALAITPEGHLVVSEGTTSLVKVFRYLHMLDM